MEQGFNEALLKLCILLYQVDGKITLSEQDYYQAVFSNIEWEAGQDLDFLQTQAIHLARQAIDNNEVNQFVMSLKDSLSQHPHKALKVAHEIAGVDGHIAQPEQDILDYLQNRVLAKALAD